MEFLYFKKLYQNERLCEFKAKNKEEWLNWRENFRLKLVELLGGFPERCVFNLRVLNTKDFEDYKRELIIFNSAEDIEVYAYLLTPKKVEFPVPAVIAIPGHGIGMNDAVGLDEDGNEREVPSGYMKDFGISLVKEGFITLVIEQLGFGYRKLVKNNKSSSCRELFFWALMLGKTVIGLRVWDIIRSIDLLQSFPEVKKDSIGIYGISGGGTSSLFASALDDRIKATVISGYLNTFKDSILSISHCECNYLYGILKYAEMYDIAGLIAPRFLFIEHGIKDPIFPIEGTKFSFSKVKKVYDFLNVSNNLDYEFFEGGHEIWGNKSFKWLKNVLA
jgi:dienelactone hydrolase